MKPHEWSDEDEDGQSFDDPKIERDEQVSAHWARVGNYGIECEVKEPKE